MNTNLNPLMKIPLVRFAYCPCGLFDLLYSASTVLLVQGQSGLRSTYAAGDHLIEIISVARTTFWLHDDPVFCVSRVRSTVRESYVPPIIGYLNTVNVFEKKFSIIRCSTTS